MTPTGDLHLLPPSGRPPPWWWPRSAFLCGPLAQLVEVWSWESFSGKRWGGEETRDADGRGRRQLHLLPEAGHLRSLPRFSGVAAPTCHGTWNGTWAREREPCVTTPLSLSSSPSRCRSVELPPPTLGHSISTTLLCLSLTAQFLSCEKLLRESPPRGDPDASSPTRERYFTPPSGGKADPDAPSRANSQLSSHTQTEFAT